MGWHWCYLKRGSTATKSVISNFKTPNLQCRLQLCKLASSSNLQFARAVCHKLKLQQLCRSGLITPSICLPSRDEQSLTVLLPTPTLLQDQNHLVLIYTSLQISQAFMLLQVISDSAWFNSHLLSLDRVSQFAPAPRFGGFDVSAVTLLWRASCIWLDHHIIRLQYAFSDVQSIAVSIKRACVHLACRAWQCVWIEVSSLRKPL